jgi:hypothetical protein
MPSASSGEPNGGPAGSGAGSGRAGNMTAL